MSSARSAIARLGLARSLRESQIGASRSVGSIRCFSDDKGRVLSDEERAKETIYIQKMEKEILERKKRLEQQKSESERGKKPEEKKP
ncbi:F1F0-ATPase inhibitor protein [Hirschfeldia incana]|nr:F1F0-ATPase inhibitor protein [Hirschfeldia incana]